VERGGEDLGAAVLPVTDIHRAVGPDPEAVRQVELPRRLFARIAPGGDQAAVLREAMHAAVAVAVRDVEIARWRRDHLGGLVERAGRAGVMLDVLGWYSVGGLVGRT